MDEALLEIKHYHGEGYKPLIDSGTWRVAILRYADELRPDRMNTMERHAETDEVFVLMKGCGVLIIGGNGDQVDRVIPQPLDLGELYIVKRQVWHTIFLGREADVLIVENQDTGDHNTEFCDLTADQQDELKRIGKREGFI